MRRDMKVLARQRMDFLLLFSPQERVVLEVDGQQHYSQDGRPSPRLYAKMAAADRELRLLGYEVFRFGGHELSGSGSNAILQRFFDQLLMKHGVARESV
jgi:very-short-patch-repair endonuclease